MSSPCRQTTLPASVKVIADCIGVPAALALVESSPHRKHRCVYVPASIPDDHWIARAIGREAADKLAATFGRELLPLANCAALKRAERNREIQGGVERGESVASLARRFGLTRTRVMQVILGDYGPLRITGRGARRLPPRRAKIEQLTFSMP